MERREGWRERERGEGGERRGGGERAHNSSSFSYFECYIQYITIYTSLTIVVVSPSSADSANSVQGSFSRVQKKNGQAEERGRKGVGDDFFKILLLNIDKYLLLKRLSLPPPPHHSYAT